VRFVYDSEPAACGDSSLLAFNARFHETKGKRDVKLQKVPTAGD